MFLQIIVVVIIVIIIRELFWKEGFQNNDEKDINSVDLYFLSGEEAALFIDADKDGYFAGLNTMDLHVRGCDSIADYKKKIRGSFVDCIDKQKYKDCIQDLMEDLLEDVPEWINKEKFMQMPWKLAFVKGNDYEYGWPHTRLDVIFLPENYDDDLTKLLLHEQCHVYQKKYAGEFRRYIESQGFMRVREKNSGDAANPDSDGWVYMRDGVEWGGYYKNGQIMYRPINKPAYDHPCEYFVYKYLD
jgi:hypothetical protein